MDKFLPKPVDNNIDIQDYANILQLEDWGLILLHTPLQPGGRLGSNHKILQFGYSLL
jgi:hypothetical protein